jgi:hypothetical protein
VQITDYPPGRSRRLQLGGDEGRCSTVWGVFSAKHSADFYICPRMAGGAVKISLHQSGSWHAGLTLEHVRQNQIVDSRHWDVWERGQNDLAPGTLRAWYLLLPDQELRSGSCDEKAYQLPAVGAGHAASVEFLMMSDDGPKVLFDDAHVVGRWRLATRPESCLVVARCIPWTKDLQRWANDARNRAASDATAAGVLPEQNHRYYFHGHDAQGVRFGLELAPPKGAA